MNGTLSFIAESYVQKLQCFFLKLLKKIFFNLIIYFWLCWVFVDLPGHSLLSVSRAALHCCVPAPPLGSFSCGARAPGMGGLDSWSYGALELWASVVLAQQV